MEQAKVVMNLKEGIIELEGPLEFVQKYLDTYYPTVKKSSRLYTTPEFAPPEEVVPSPKKIVAHRTKGKAARQLSCAECIRLSGRGRLELMVSHCTK